MLKLLKQPARNLQSLHAGAPLRRNRLAGSAPLEAKVMLASGTITIKGTQKATSANLKKWQNAQHLKGSGTIDLQGKTLTMKNNPNGSIVGLKFKNGGIKIVGSNNFKFSNNTLTANSGLVRAFNFASSSNVTISGNKASGKLSNGITVNSGSGHKISNNTLTRTTNEGAGAGNKKEDHGIYVLNKVSSATISGNKTSGWSTKPSGHGLKLKDISDIKVSGNTFGSGIIIRTNAKRSGIFSNVSFTNNKGKGGINADAASKKLGKNNKASGNSIGKVDIK
jgi:parallel beta-helix repeat protein